MRRSGPESRTFLLDNNVFIAAIKEPTRETATLRLILKIIQDRAIRLVGNEFLLEEMARYAEAFGSETASLLLYALISRMEVVEVREKFIRICRAYMDTEDLVDVIHAATCLQTDAILITNDRHFDPVRDEGVVEVWSTTEAIRNLL
jgi:predicted nucleic acid-binding protein